ncbi:MAG: DEAD/DEAH box helicase, partial [Acidimicrobiaceae bacterium]|nr:DEAD/DEAH box helicase [Acidimicrobiaceae bacterium]
WNVSSTERTEVAADAVTAAGSAIVFCRTRHGCDRLARRFDRIGVRAAAIHGGRSQNQRTRALQAFAAGRVEALIATDVAARGIHVEGVSAVIHYDLPGDHKTYLHRSGRTARAGRGGVVVSLVQPGQVKELRQMQRELDLQQPLTDVDLHAVRSHDGGPSRPIEPAAIADPARQSAVDSQPRRADSRPRHPDAKQRSRKPERGGTKNRSRRRRSNNRRPRPPAAKQPMAKARA